MFARQLSRELITLILIKIAALTVLFFVFIAPMKRPPIDGDAAARNLLSGGAAAASAKSPGS